VAVGRARAGPVTGADDLLLGQYLTEKYGLPSIARAALSEAIETVAHGRHFHPIREYLQALQWDGKQRVDKWLVFALGETPETLPKPAVFEYLRLVGRFWLLGMVNRVMDPGCKFDYCPVLEGPGGLGKSTLVEALAGPEYFSDTHFDVSRGKEGQEQVQGLWLYEIAELPLRQGRDPVDQGLHQRQGRPIPTRATGASWSRSRASACWPARPTSAPTCATARAIGASGRSRCATASTSRGCASGATSCWPRPSRCTRPGAPFTPDAEDEERLFVPMQESRLVETAVLSRAAARAHRPPGHRHRAMVNELTDFVTMASSPRRWASTRPRAAPRSRARSAAGWSTRAGSTERNSRSTACAPGATRPRELAAAGRACAEADNNQAGAAGEPVTEGADDDEPF
jgi:putative DNA primase/helicase